MKVVHLISSFGAGGAELLVKDIAIYTKGNINVEVWAVGETNDKLFEEKYINELAGHNIPCVKIGKIAGKNKFQVVRKLRKYLIERHPDIVNAHSELVTFYVAAASIGLKTIVVQTVHNTVVTYPLAEKYFAGKSVKKFIAISQKCKALIENKITADQKKIKLIYNGIYIEKFQQRERVIREGVQDIMSIGRLDVQKDHETLLRSFSILAGMLKAEGISIPKLNIIGAGILYDKLQKLAVELNIQNYTNFMGVRNDVPSLLYENDLWVMSSRWEGLSIALMEALASGIPVIASNAGSNDELVEDGVNGILVEKQSPKKLAEALFRVIKDFDLRKSLSQNARTGISNFHISKCAENYALLYHDLINKNLKRRGSLQIRINEEKAEISN